MENCTIVTLENHDIYKAALHAEAELARARVREIEAALELVDPTEKSAGSGWGSSDPQGFLLENLEHAISATESLQATVTRVHDIVSQDPRYQS